MKYTNPSTRLHRLIAMAALLGAGSASAQTAHPGDLDSTFGQGGYLATDFFGTDEQAYAVAPMGDGRFVAAGVVIGPNASGPGGSPNVAVARYLANGALDPSFARAGLFNLDIDGGSDETRAIKVLPDQGVLMAATLSTHAHADFGLVKLRADGTLDTAFGEADEGSARKGWVRLDIGGPNIHDEAWALAVQSDGRVLVAGRTRVVMPNNAAYTRVAVARFRANGDVDTSFGGNGNGFVVLPQFLSDDTSDDLAGIALTRTGALAADDRIVVVGHTSGRNNAFLMRLTANGALDPTFGNGGRVAIQAGSSGGVQVGVSTISAARLAADGRILILGEGGDRGMTVMRFTASGALDTSFGNKGRALLKFSGIADYDEPAALALQPNGKIVAAGYATNRATGAPRKDFFVGRLLADGALDLGFGNGAGYTVAQVATGNDEAYAVDVESSGNILAGGYRQTGIGTDFALLRLFGDPERIFANGFDDRSAD